MQDENVGLCPKAVTLPFGRQRMFRIFHRVESLTLELGLNVLVSEMSLYLLHSLDGGGNWDRAHY